MLRTNEVFKYKYLNKFLIYLNYRLFMYFWGQIWKGKYDTGAYTNRQNNRLSSLGTGADFLKKPSFLIRTLVSFNRIACRDYSSK